MKSFKVFYLASMGFLTKNFKERIYIMELKAQSEYKLTMQEKVGYSMGDLACNLIYTTVCTYLLFFYTNVYGLGAEVVATMFLVVRVMDAIVDPIVGTFVDKHTYKHGKFRPYLLYGAIPFAILGILCFSTPLFDDSLKIIYAYATYVGLSLVYTTINIPYGALTAAMTRDNKEIVSLTSIRMLCANFGGVLVAFGVPVLVTMISGSYTGEDSRYGWQVTMGVFSVVGALLLLYCFSNTNERVKIDPQNDENVKFVDVIHQFKVNRPLVILSLFFIILFGMMAVMNSIGAYFITYNCARPDLMQWYGLLGSIPAFFLLPLVPFFNELVGKIRLLIISLCLGVFGAVLTYFIPADNITAILIARFISSCGIIVAGGFMWALIPETIEYGEYKTGKRLSGMIYAIIGFFFKFGLALGGIIPGFMLARFGYIANQVQTPEALEGILLTTTIIPIVFLIIAIIDISFYNLDDKKYKEIIEVLESRKLNEAVHITETKNSVTL